MNELSGPPGRFALTTAAFTRRPASAFAEQVLLVRTCFEPSKEGERMAGRRLEYSKGTKQATTKKTSPKSSIEFRRYINEVELQACPKPKKWHFEFLKALPLEAPATVDDIVDLRALIPGPSRSSFPSHPIFGGEPLWIQSPQPPVGPDGKPMRFIGQVQATHFTSSVADFELYLFYSRKHQLVTQVAQIS